MIKAVIFDKDGVIHQSLDGIIKARHNYLKKYNIDDLNLVKKSMHSPRDFVRLINKRYKAGISKKDFDMKTRKEIAEYIKDVGVNKGLLEFLKELSDNNIKFAIASNNCMEYIIYDLKNMNVLDLFPVIISTDDVKNHKPHPEMFLKAAEKLGIDPKDCVGIEDAVKGIYAINNAGMKSIAFVTKYTSEENFKDANLIISSFDELNLEKINKL